MRLTAFASRNTKEILRDPLTFCFGLGFPVVLLLLLSAINSAIPEQVSDDNVQHRQADARYYGFRNELISLFSSMLIAKDRTTSFMMRLFTSSAQSTRVYYRLHTSAFANGNFAECHMRC